MCRGVTRGAFERGREKFVVVIKADPVLACRLANGHELFDRIALGFRLIDFFLHSRIIVSHHHLDLGGVKTIFQVFGGKHVRCRDGDCANAVQCQQKEPEFVATAQNQHHAVALLDSLLYEKVCRALGGKRQILERENMAFVVVIAPHERFAFRLVLGIFVNDIVCKVKVVRNRYLEILVQVFVRVVIYPRYKSV